ncbi:MAG: hypothetical protein AB8I08_18675 [Sandaracinaceae bacterium]
MDIQLQKSAVRQIKLSAQDAIEEGDTDTLREDILEAFTDEHIEEIELRIESGDFYEFISNILEEWGGDDVDDLLELLGQELSDAGVVLNYEDPKDGDDGDDEDDDFDLDDDDL